jgi:8-oxo-dGTP diphosphatase
VVEEGSAVILIDRAGRILLQQRDDDIPPQGAGRWTIPGGGREGEEDPRQTALREFEEETGARLERLRFFRSFPASSGRTTALHLFFADDDVPRERIEVREGLDFRYWTRDEIADLPINPLTREILADFLASDAYVGTVEANQPGPSEGAVVIEIDRWGRVLLQLRDRDLPPERWPNSWCLPGGRLRRGESPDEAAFREFEEETGHLLDALKLFRTYRKDRDLPSLLVDLQHVYYVDADLDAAMLDVNEGEALQYFGPSEMADLEMPPHHRAILEEFFESPAYRAMFH